ncbi:nucleoside triphosphate pyrophosphohydrolase [Priestia aryabhattai]|uniref:nucleoside triphosphate pyrophosphohydrolase n=1 Tax=Priestia TaxID=2800373 RepID=UPI000BF7AC97|nr:MULTISPECIES: nucleoside triphosphate pyrophosphohydrolase [Priestia]MED3919441.1 nucleoside triphosphate pyrophosphohydrolase [Priestia aryabhattai]MED3958593.1 nucleoside triphosphate pyrophosphohydrolase [Priestia aryabhattai]MED3992902.1 nucleoside triphosphate pyrophosphohydrolase [Priestia aryabhattai]PGA13523.1 phosphoribosyl-ATP pyrophosphohydrolase [Priestia aryabhattai]UOO38914.1 nucleoside triphosphate pyrophosphohydrolase [Priestia megaterium]
MLTYNKLVRDKIPTMIEQSGNTFKSRVLQREEYQNELKEKAKEELQEYIEAQTHQDAIEELADLLEVMHALAAVHGATPEQLEKVREEKAKERGKFDGRIYLVKTEEA